jgi:hypothetical protein
MAVQRVHPSQTPTATIADPNSSQMIANTIRLRVPGCTMAASLDGELAQFGRQPATCVAGVHPATEVAIQESCTLPLAERPLRLAEFDALFASGLTAQQRPSPTVLRWTLDPHVEQAARELAARETACCSFFTFHILRDGNAVHVDIEVPPTQVMILDVLATRASAGMAAA